MVDYNDLLQRLIAMVDCNGWLQWLRNRQRQSEISAAAYLTQQLAFNKKSALQSPQWATLPWPTPRSVTKTICKEPSMLGRWLLGWEGIPISQEIFWPKKEVQYPYHPMRIYTLARIIPTSAAPWHRFGGVWGEDNQTFEAPATRGVPVYLVFQALFTVFDTIINAITTVLSSCTRT